MDIISLRAVSKSYPSADTRLQVLREVDLDVEEGEFAVVAVLPEAARAPCST